MTEDTDARTVLGDVKLGAAQVVRYDGQDTTLHYSMLGLALLEDYFGGFDAVQAALEALEKSDTDEELPEGFAMFRTVGALVHAGLPDPSSRTVDQALARMDVGELYRYVAAVQAALLVAFRAADAEGEAPRPAANRAARRSSSRGGSGTTRQRSSSGARTKHS